MATQTATTIEYLNRDGSVGGRIEKRKYDAVKKALLKAIPKSADGVAFRELPAHVQRELPKDMLPKPGSASWLATTVKLDLEARGMIERIDSVSPQRVRRV